MVSYRATGFVFGMQTPVDEWSHKQKRPAVSRSLMKFKIIHNPSYLSNRPNNRQILPETLQRSLAGAGILQK